MYVESNFSLDINKQYQWTSRFVSLILSQLSDIDFQDSVMTLGFSEETRATLLGLYTENQREVRDILQEMSMDLPHYRDLQWRFDMQVRTLSSL